MTLPPNSEKIKSIELYNILGQSVYRNLNTYEGTYNEYEVQNLATGTYVIKLATQDNRILTKKIIVK